MTLHDHFAVHVAEGAFVVSWTAPYDGERTSEDAIVCAGRQYGSVVATKVEVHSLLDRCLDGLHGDVAFDPPADAGGNYPVEVPPC